MPIYTFVCKTCNTSKEQLVKMGTTEIECKDCGNTATKDMMGSMKFAAHGLPNGHIGVRNKR